MGKGITELTTFLQKKNILVILVIGILLLVISMPANPKKEESKNLEEESHTSTSWSEASYIEHLENRLEESLEQMKGVGDVSVMITLSASSEKIVEKDIETRMSEESEDHSEQVVYSGETGEETPYVRQERSPVIEGILVIAEGGDNAVVVQNITEAVQALFGVDTHKIKVMKHN